MDNSFPLWLWQSSWITSLGFGSVVSSRNSLWGREQQPERVCVTLSGMRLHFPTSTLLQHWSQKTHRYFSPYSIKSVSGSVIRVVLTVQFSYNRNDRLIIHIPSHHLPNNLTLVFHVWLSIAAVPWPRISTSSQRRHVSVLNVFVSHSVLLWGCGEVWGQMLSLVPCL